jgi:4-amino-4-deoxy-L-arabinose transferase-like glycosyltransferase
MRLPGLHAALVLVAFGAGVLLRATNLGDPAFSFDEFYHVFAARSLLAGEGLHLPSGRPYVRSWLVTLLTAGAFALFGESEAAARLPALVFGTLTLALTYAAGRFLFGPTAGLVALVLLAFSPDAIDVDRFARLYSPLTLLTLLAALAAFRALEGAGEEGPRATRARLGWLALAAGAGLAAVHLHPVALGLLVVVQAYSAARALGLLLRGRSGEAARYGAVAVGLLGLEALGAASAELRTRVLEAALTPLPWYTPVPGDAMTYHYHLAAQYAWLWYLVWPATVVLVLARPRPGLFAALAFWLPFVLVSGVVATKSLRYIVHLLPFAWLLLGGAAGVLWPAAREALLARLSSLLPPWAAREARLRRAAVAAVLLLAAAPLVRLSPSVVAALRRPSQTAGAFTTGNFADWRGLRRVLGARLEPDARVVASIPLASRYYLGRPAYHLIGSQHRRADGTRERPEMEGERQVVQHPADLAALRTSGKPVWVIAERWRWEERIDTRLKQMVVQECLAVPTPPALAFVVFACEGAGNDRRRLGELRRCGGRRSGARLVSRVGGWQPPDGPRRRGASRPPAW